MNALGNHYIDIINIKKDNLIEDRVVWTAGSSGEFKLKDTYNALRGQAPKVQWKSLVWFSHCIPRHCFIVWVSLHRGLKTRFKLNSWGLDVDPVCVLCNHMLEDDLHLLFHCSYSMQIWEKNVFFTGIKCFETT
ncbi:hypothetical protein MKX03_018977 [Papaver bracteatum]|nr:hypothetical protein MKX03_018977 [Papaver bracteatum]